MCGISGFFGKIVFNNSSFSDALLDVLGHRGPDARGVYHEDGIFLGHLRLSILDLSADANQPMFSQTKRYVIVYNGEIYNYEEIAIQIKKHEPSFSPSTTSDTEIILESFAIWGVRCVEKFNGMFSIAIWDKQERKLYLLRDRLGIKPLYLFSNHGSLAFSSELKGLTALPAIKNELTVDIVAVNQFLHLGYIPAPRSIYTQISKFPQGHYGIYQDGKLELTSYWHAGDKIHNLDNTPAISTSEALAQLRALVVSSVQYRLIADVPYGTFLSGGIDSSLVTAVAQSLHTSPVNTFSIGFWDKQFDESGHAEKVARHLGTNHHRFMVTEKDALEWMPGLNDIYDEPFADSSAIPTLLVSQMARKHVTVTLSGDGGDELFMGYGAYLWAERLNNPLLSMMALPASRVLPFGPQKYRRAAELLRKVPSDILKSHIFSQEQYLFSRRETHQLLTDTYKSDFTLSETYKGMDSKLDPASQQALFDLGYYLPDDLLVKVDRASMHFALETRVPLLDYRIVEWALNLPLSMKMRDGESKWLLKKLLYQYVPEELFQRPKRGFAIPLQKWLLHDLRDFAMDHINADAIKSVGIFNPKEADKLIRSFYQGGQHWKYNRLWLMIVLQRWFIKNSG